MVLHRANTTQCFSFPQSALKTLCGCSAEQIYEPKFTSVYHRTLGLGGEGVRREKSENENEREAGSAPWRESVDSLWFPVLRLVVIKYRKITVLASFGADVLSGVSCI